MKTQNYEKLIENNKIDNDKNDRYLDNHFIQRKFTLKMQK